LYNYPVEKHILRFYKYKFSGYKEVITVEAYNRAEARRMLREYVSNTPELHKVKVISETLSLPIFGETTKSIDGLEYVWVGNMSADNWMLLSEFKKLNLT
jgi:hypothetical protein